MSSLIIRKLGGETQRRLRIRAAEHGRSVEDEALEILRGALASEPTRPLDLASSIQQRVARVGGVELELPDREPIREPPELG